MKQLILSSHLYQDDMSIMASSMEFEDAGYGKEILNFQYIPSDLEEFFSTLLNTPVEIQSNTGIFRKPYPFIHYENFYQHSLWICIVALENTTLKLHKHVDKGYTSFFDVKDESIEEFIVSSINDPLQWTTTTQINIEKNDYIFIRPWAWHSLEQDKLVQVFMINQKLEQKE